MNGSDMPGSARRGWRATLADNLAAGSERRGAGVGRLLLAAVMIGLGIRGLTYADFASVWQRIPIAHLPARMFFVYACALVELATGIGLLLRRALPAASGILAAYLLLWACC
jgi:DoxX.